MREYFVLYYGGVVEDEDVFYCDCWDLSGRQQGSTFALNGWSTLRVSLLARIAPVCPLFLQAALPPFKPNRRSCREQNAK